MRKKIVLKDRTKVLIRSLKMEDLDKSLRFFRALPEEDRAYLRVDVTKRAIVKKRIASITSQNMIRLIAIVDNDIIADGSLEFERDSWEKHVAELRLIVARPFQRKGLGMLMARELFSIGVRKKVEEIIVKFMRPQAGARKIMKRLGFHRDAVLRDFVKDINGIKHDLIIMRCDLDSLWQKVEEFMVDWDWQRSR
jgi:RimJ/RimL family protein N-acetyltransferase